MNTNNKLMVIRRGMTGLMLLALSSLACAAAIDTGICHGKHALYVMNFRELRDARAEVPPDPATIKKCEDVQADDYLTVGHLKSLGFDVTITDEFSPVDLAAGKDLILISESIDANEVGAKYTNLSIPVVCWENDLYDDLKMVGKRLNVDYGTYRVKSFTSVRLWNASHPLSGGQAAGAQKVFNEPREINWGRPGPGAVVVATNPGEIPVAGEADKALIFAYEKGATMDSEFLAPARRVGLWLWQNDFGSLAPAGVALFDAAIVWAVTPPPPRPANADPAVARGKHLLYVMNLHELERLKADVPLDAARIKHQEKVMTNDNKIIEHLKQMGFAVTVADEHPTEEVTAGQDLVVLSNSIDPKQLQGKYKLLPIPVFTWASELYGEMAFTGKVQGQDFGMTGTPGPRHQDGDRFGWIVNAPHPLAAGLTADIIQNLYDDNEYFTNWGKPSLGAINIATIPGYRDRRIDFAYEKGATMDGDFIAPARRVAFFLNTYDFDHILPAGLALFDAGVLWAVSKP